MTSDHRPPLRDYSLLFPVLVGILSLIGIGVLVAAAWFPGQETPVLPTQTLTPFRYLFLGTETDTPAPRPQTATASESFPTVTSEGDITTLPAPTEQSGTLAVIPLLTLTGQTGTPTGEFSTPILTITPDSIFAGAEPLAAGTYDAVDSQIIRGGNWANQASANAYQGTLLVSVTVGDYLALSFVGYQMTLGYQGSDSAGNLMVSIDGSEAPLTQRVGNLWFSEELAPGTHYVIITHATGASVNLDYLEIFD